MWTFFKLRLLLGLVPLLGAVLWMGMGGGETYYDKSPKEVKAALASAYVPTHVLGSTVKGSKVSQPDGQTVVTSLLDKDGVELMRFVTTVTADGTGSLVETEVRGPEGKHAERAAAAMEKQAFAMSLLEKLANEHVAAAIEERPFDMMFAAPDAAKGMMAAMPGMSEDINAANKSAAELARMEQEAEFVSEYGDDWGGNSASAADGWAE